MKQMSRLKKGEAPARAAGSNEEKLLMEIRDALKGQRH
jgi:large-conductance mechanosensitive channel